MNLKTTCQVNISSNKIKNCQEIVEYLKQLNIPANVTSNLTIVKKNDEMVNEIGCTIIYSCDIKKMYNELWQPLKKKYYLTCAHIDVKSHFQGCIYDLYRKSKCPGCI